jgi:hypothetical protein
VLSLNRETLRIAAFHRRYRIEALKRFVLIAFGIHLAIGNLCTMSSASAQGMPEMPMYESSLSMSMSPGDCEHCPTQESDDGSQDQKSPCAKGHCVSEAASTTSIAFSSFTTGIAPSSVPTAVQIAPINLPGRPFATAPPNTHLVTTTIVLRF